MNSEQKKKLQTILEQKTIEIVDELQDLNLSKSQIKNELLKLLDKRIKPRQRRTKKIVRTVLLISDSSDNEN
jgi:hypothetical protein